jgi:hypothetical protein
MAGAIPAAARLRDVMTDIFISYSTKDGSHEANELVAALEAAGRRCWIAPRDMKPGVEYPTQIITAIRDCRGFVLVLTPGANVSRDVLQEVTIAHNGNKLIVPLIVRDTQPLDGLLYFSVARQQIVWTDAKAAAAALGKVFASTSGAASAQQRPEAQGDRADRADEQRNLGIKYLNGDGVPQSDTEAVKWFRLAAEQGNADGQFELGLAYDEGYGVTQCDTEAVRWYRLAADQGQSSAQCNLGMMYDTGRGVAQSDKEAVRWFRLAADQGLSSAQVNLGSMYEYGQGVPQDRTEAMRWYRVAAAQGDKEAQRRVESLDR